MRETDPLKAIPQSGNYSLTYGGVLGHLLCEEAEHLGQIEYLRGMMRGSGMGRSAAEGTSWRTADQCLIG